MKQPADSEKVRRNAIRNIRIVIGGGLIATGLGVGDIVELEGTANDTEDAEAGVADDPEEGREFH